MFRGRARKVTSRATARWRAGVWGFFSGLFGLAAFLAFAAIGVIIFAIMQSGPSANGEVFSLIVVAFVAFVTLMLIHGLCRYAAGAYRQRSDDIDAQTLHDRLGAGEEKVGDFILYLRPFESTAKVTKTVRSTTLGPGGRIESSTSQTYEMEEQFSKAARPLAPFVALGHTMEHIGAGRIATSEEEWQTSALHLMRAAALIILVPSARPGTLWEIDRILELGLMPKTLVLNAPAGERLFSGFSQRDDWNLVRERFAAAGYQLPAHKRSGNMILFGAQKRPVRTMKPHIERSGQLRSALKRALKLTRRR